MPTDPYDDVWRNDSVERYFKTDLSEQMLALFEQGRVQTILDLGSGDGTNAVALAKLGKTVHALEVSCEGIKKTKLQAQEAGVFVHILEQDMYQTLPFAERSLDAVIAFQSLNHNTLPKIEELFVEITRVLKPGGLFIVKTANFASLHPKELGDGLYEISHGDYSFALRFSDEQTYVPQNGPEKGLTHYCFLPEQLSKKMDALGYSQLYAEILEWHFLSAFKKK